jgi:Secretion system C-terminal sorting domain
MKHLIPQQFLLCVLLISSYTTSGQAFLINDDWKSECIQEDPPDIAMNKNGDYVIAWRDVRNGDYDIFIQRFNSNGQPVGQNMRVNSDIYYDNPGWTDHTDPAIAMNEQGEIIVAWGDRRQGYFDVWAQRIDNNGKLAGNNFLVNDDTTGAYNSTPGVAIGPNGDFVIAWNDTRENDYDVFAQIYTSNGSKKGVNFKVNTAGETNYGFTKPGTGIDGNGNFGICWTDDRRSKEADVYFQLYKADGTPVGKNTMANDTFTQHVPQTIPTMAMNGKGDFVIGWLDYPSLSPFDPDFMAQRFDASGNRQGSNFIVNDDNSGENQEDFDVAMNNKGEFILSWRDMRKDVNFGDIYAQRYDADGNTIGANFLADDYSGLGAQAFSACGIDDNGNFVIAWRDDRGPNDIIAINYNNQGNVSKASYKVNDDQGAGLQQYPATSMNEKGDFVAVWVDNRKDPFGDIYVQQFNEVAHKINGNYMANDDNFPYMENIMPSVSINNKGQFVIVWVDRRKGNCLETFAQYYDENGVAKGKNIKVEDLSCTYHESPDVALGDDGSSVITWYDNRDDDDIYARMLKADRTPAGPSWKVNDDPSQHNQYQPAIAMDAAKNFIITWIDERSYGRHIYAQRYFADGTPDGANFKVSTHNLSFKFHCDVAMDKTGNFAITWIDEFTSEDNPAVMLQYFDSVGNPIDTNIVINDNLDTSDRENTAISYDPMGGRFIITWSDYRNQGNPDVYAQIYEPGSIPDTNFIISDHDQFPNNFQLSSANALACNHDRIISVWMDNQRHKGWDIYGKLMDWSLISVGNEQLQSNYPLFSLYPNPATETIQLEFTKPLSSETYIVVYDVFGKLVFRTKVPDQSNYMDINIRDFPNGIYLIRWTNGLSDYSRKLIISH